MNKLLIASALASIALFAGSAEAACRQVYGGTSCNRLGQCWHNPPKTVCDAPAPRLAPVVQRPLVVQPGTGGRIITDNGSGLISNNQGGILINNGSNLISNNRGGIISDHATGLTRR